MPGHRDRLVNRRLTLSISSPKPALRAFRALSGEKPRAQQEAALGLPYQRRFRQTFGVPEGRLSNDMFNRAPARSLRSTIEAAATPSVTAIVSLISARV